VQRHDFAYELPPDLIAQSPLTERSASRLLILDGPGTGLADGSIRDLPDLLRSGDLLVLNDTKVVAARLAGTKPSGGRVEIFLERVLPSPREALVQMRASKPIREGLDVVTNGGVVRVLDREEDLWRIECPSAALEFFEKWGEVPLPPYIHRAADASDRERYQSIFARERGAVAAPTASLHFDSQLVEQIEARGVSRAFVTLHVGAGTFQPIRTNDLETHTMHAERVSVGLATCEAIEKTRAAGGRVVAVGTTVVRALESAVLATAGTHGSAPPRDVETRTAPVPVKAPVPLTPWSGETRLFIRPGFRFQVTDALVTNFHLPESTLLMLVCAFAGQERVLAAYRHAVQVRYRFFSYGDAMFLTRVCG
jgi:S-adenosylmethionine:tRNA ribosyltransferase-isomerase